MVQTKAVLETLVAAAQSMGSVALIAAMGGFMSWRQVLNGANRKAVARLLTNLLLPMLLFTKVSAAVAAAGPRIVHWLVLLAYVGFHVGLGILTAAAVSNALSRRRRKVLPRRDADEEEDDDDEPAVAVLTSSQEMVVNPGSSSRPAEEDDWTFVLLLMTLAFPNSGSLVLALADPLCASKTLHAMLGDDCAHQTVGYVSFYFPFLNLVMWCVCPLLLRRRRRPESLGQALLDDDDDGDGEASRDDEEPSFSARLTRTRAFRTAQKLSVKLSAVPPPVLAALCGAFVGAVPGLRKAVLGNEQRQTVLGAATTTVGNAAIPLGIVNLGAAIEANAGRSGVQAMPLVLVVAVPVLRLVVIPAVSISLTTLIRGNVVLVPRSDKALALVLMLEAAPPPAMQTMVFVQLFNQKLERPLAQLLVSSYFLCLLTLTTWIAIILSLLSADDDDD